MSGATLLQALAERGIHVELDGTRLRYVAVRGLDPAARDELRAHKTELLREMLARMRDDCVGDLSREWQLWPSDAREAFEERAAIIEFDGGVDRESALILAEIGIRSGMAERGAP